jgi:hypothetical protein
VTTSLDPVCAWCHPPSAPRASDLPVGTMFFCPPHQKLVDKINASLEKVLLLPPGAAGEDFTFKGLLEPGLIGNGIVTAPVEPQPEPPVDAYESIRRWAELVATSPLDLSLEQAILTELTCAVSPIAPVELTIRLARIARAHFWRNRKPFTTTTEYEVTWRSETGSVCASVDELSTLRRAEELGASRVGAGGIVRFTISRREHETYGDGSSFTGAWVPCGGSIPDDERAHR